jgi:hypothetical protein
MEKVFEQSAKMMEQAWNDWKNMFEDNRLWPGDKQFQENVSNSLTAMSTALNTNVEVWNVFMDKNEQIFFSMFKDSPFHNDAVEQKMKDAWDIMRKGQKGYQEIVKDNLDKIKDLVKDGENAGE